MDEVTIEYIEPCQPSGEELHSWGLIRWQEMTREEVKKRFPTEYQRLNFGPELP